MRSRTNRDVVKRLIIFEGIASSGKTTLEHMLHEWMKGSTIISEARTLMPIVENKESRRAIAHLSMVLDDVDRQSGDACIVDRFHFTHAFRTGSPLSTFHAIEERIAKCFTPLVVFLRMNDAAVPDRIKETMKFRGSSWSKGKQGTDEEKTVYYRNQQTVLKGLMEQSILPVTEIDTSNKDWPRCLTEILRAVHRGT